MSDDAVTSGADDDAVVDVAIVGGGVSGCYTAYRLVTTPGPRGPRSVHLFELSDRIGGRLWSVELDGLEDVPAEFGGMYFSDLHENVYGLVTKELGLPFVDVGLRRDLQYLRGRRLTDDDFAHPDRVPYQLAPAEQGKSPGMLLLWMLQTILPDLPTLWPLGPGGSREETVKVLRETVIGGRPLHQWGYWNLLSDRLSHEAYQMLLSTVGSTTLFRNWNAYDAVYDFVTDLAGKYHKVTSGYQELPETLARRFQDRGGRVHLRSRLVRLGRDGDLMTLELSAPDGALRRVRARQVVLALPQRGLELVDSPDVLFEDGGFRSDFRAVVGVPASKIFLAYDHPWWESVPSGPGPVATTELVVSYTDLPMRQCYYLGTSKRSGRGLVMASYGDGSAASYWSGYLRTSRWGPGLAPYEASHRVLAHRHMRSSAAMVDEVTKQLSQLHGTTVPPPIDALFHDWGADPYGGGWHSWMPFVQSWSVMPRVRHPTARHPVYVCGESYALDQGWVEGAVNTAERVLETYFDLDRPGWVAGDYSFGP